LQLNAARADLAVAQKKLKQFDDKLSADESDIKDVCVKSKNLSNTLSRPENVAARESLGADFLTDQAIVKNVACRLEGRMQ
jgi:multidrug resistance efflux pump